MLPDCMQRSTKAGSPAWYHCSTNCRYGNCWYKTQLLVATRPQPAVCALRRLTMWVGSAAPCAIITPQQMLLWCLPTCGGWVTGRSTQAGGQADCRVWKLTPAHALLACAA
jgi:hypothetical protein